MENVVLNQDLMEKNVVKRVYTVSVYKGEKHSNKKFTSYKKAYEYANRRYVEVDVDKVNINFTCEENTLLKK